MSLDVFHRLGATQGRSEDLETQQEMPNEAERREPRQGGGVSGTRLI